MDRHDEIAALDATAQAALVRDGEVTPLELVDGAIARIERLNPNLNAVIHRSFDRARREAAGDLPAGPFRGVPFLLKDLGAGNLAGDPIHWGTRFLRDAGYRAPTTSYLVEKFRGAGLVIVGRTNVPELGAWTTTEPEAYGATRSPWNPERSTGGSSGGSAAAVASRMVPVAHASDGGGSIRIPASECGLVGLKTSRGRISLGPDTAEMWEGMAVEFAVSRSVRDTAVLLDAVAGAMPGDPDATPPPVRPYREDVGRPSGTLRVGLLDRSDRVAVHPNCAAAVETAGRVLEALGHRVEIEHPPPLEDAAIGMAIVQIITASQARMIDAFGQAIGRELVAADMDCDNWAITEMGRRLTASEYLAALEVKNRFTRAMAGWWAAGFDLLVTPTLPEPPPRLGELVPDPAAPLKGWTRAGELVTFTLPFNVTGQPAISLPLHWTTDGLPVGVQLVAAHAREDLLIQVAAQIEEAHPWAGRRPSISA